MKSVLSLLVVSAALVACGEKPQTQTGSKADDAAFKGTGSQFSEKNWKQGDKNSWEQQLRARSQNTQNEYTRTN